MLGPSIRCYARLGESEAHYSQQLRSAVPRIGWSRQDLGTERILTISRVVEEELLGEGAGGRLGPQAARGQAQAVTGGAVAGLPRPAPAADHDVEAEQHDSVLSQASSRSGCATSGSVNRSGCSSAVSYLGSDQNEYRALLNGDAYVGRGRAGGGSMQPDVTSTDGEEEEDRDEDAAAAVVASVAQKSSSTKKAREEDELEHAVFFYGQRSRVGGGANASDDSTGRANAMLECARAYLRDEMQRWGSAEKSSSSSGSGRVAVRCAQVTSVDSSATPIDAELAASGSSSPGRIRIREEVARRRAEADGSAFSGPVRLFASAESALKHIHSKVLDEASSSSSAAATKGTTSLVVSIFRSRGTSGTSGTRALHLIDVAYPVLIKAPVEDHDELRFQTRGETQTVGDVVDGAGAGDGDGGKKARLHTRWLEHVLTMVAQGGVSAIVDEKPGHEEARQIALLLGPRVKRLSLVATISPWAADFSDSVTTLRVIGKLGKRALPPNLGDDTDWIRMLEKVFQGPPPSASVPSRGEPEVSSSLVGQADAAPRAIGSEAEAGERGSRTPPAGTGRHSELELENKRLAHRLKEMEALLGKQFHSTAEKLEAGAVGLQEQRRGRAVVASPRTAHTRQHSTSPRQAQPFSPHGGAAPDKRHQAASASSSASGASCSSGSASSLTMESVVRSSVEKADAKQRERSSSGLSPYAATLKSPRNIGGLTLVNASVMSCPNGGTSINSNAQQLQPHAHAGSSSFYGSQISPRGTMISPRHTTSRGENDDITSRSATTSGSIISARRNAREPNNTTTSPSQTAPFAPYLEPGPIAAAMAKIKTLSISSLNARANTSARSSATTSPARRNNGQRQEQDDDVDATSGKRQSNGPANDPSSSCSAASTSPRGAASTRPGFKPDLNTGINFEVMEGYASASSPNGIVHYTIGGASSSSSASPAGNANGNATGDHGATGGTPGGGNKKRPSPRPLLWPKTSTNMSLQEWVEARAQREQMFPKSPREPARALSYYKKKKKLNPDQVVQVVDMVAGTVDELTASCTSSASSGICSASVAAGGANNSSFLTRSGRGGFLGASPSPVGPSPSDAGGGALGESSSLLPARGPAAFCPPDSETATAPAGAQTSPSSERNKQTPRAGDQLQLHVLATPQQESPTFAFEAEDETDPSVAASAKLFSLSRDEEGEGATKNEAATAPAAANPSFSETTSKHVESAAAAPSPASGADAEPNGAPAVPDLSPINAAKTRPVPSPPSFGKFATAAFNRSGQTPGTINCTENDNDVSGGGASSLGCEEAGAAAGILAKLNESPPSSLGDGGPKSSNGSPPMDPHEKLRNALLASPEPPEFGGTLICEEGEDMSGGAAGGACDNNEEHEEDFGSLSPVNQNEESTHFLQENGETIITPRGGGSSSSSSSTGDQHLRTAGGPVPPPPRPPTGRQANKAPSPLQQQSPIDVPLLNLPNGPRENNITDPSGTADKFNLNKQSKGGPLPRIQQVQEVEEDTEAGDEKITVMKNAGGAGDENKSSPSSARLRSPRDNSSASKGSGAGPPSKTPTTPSDHGLHGGTGSARETKFKDQSRKSPSPRTRSPREEQRTLVDDAAARAPAASTQKSSPTAPPTAQPAAEPSVSAVTSRPRRVLVSSRAESFDIFSDVESIVDSSMTKKKMMSTALLASAPAPPQVNVVTAVSPLQNAPDNESELSTSKSNILDVLDSVHNLSSSQMPGGAAASPLGDDQHGKHHAKDGEGQHAQETGTICGSPLESRPANASSPSHARSQATLSGANGVELAIPQLSPTLSSSSSSSSSHMVHVSSRAGLGPYVSKQADDVTESAFKSSSKSSLFEPKLQDRLSTKERRARGITGTANVDEETAFIQQAPRLGGIGTGRPSSTEARVFSSTTSSSSGKRGGEGSPPVTPRDRDGRDSRNAAFSCELGDRLQTGGSSSSKSLPRRLGTPPLGASHEDATKAGAEVAVREEDNEQESIRIIQEMSKAATRSKILQRFNKTGTSDSAGTETDAESKNLGARSALASPGAPSGEHVLLLANVGEATAPLGVSVSVADLQAAPVAEQDEPEAGLNGVADDTSHDHTQRHAASAEDDHYFDRGEGDDDHQHDDSIPSHSATHNSIYSAPSRLYNHPPLPPGDQRFLFRNRMNRRVNVTTTEIRRNLEAFGMAPADFAGAASPEDQDLHGHGQQRAVFAYNEYEPASGSSSKNATAPLLTNAKKFFSDRVRQKQEELYHDQLRAGKTGSEKMREVKEVVNTTSADVGKSKKPRTPRESNFSIPRSKSNVTTPRGYTGPHPVYLERPKSAILAAERASSRGPRGESRSRSRANSRVRSLSKDGGPAAEKNSIKDTAGRRANVDVLPPHMNEVLNGRKMNDENEQHLLDRRGRLNAAPRGRGKIIPDPSKSGDDRSRSRSKSSGRYTPRGVSKELLATAASLHQGQQATMDLSTLLARRADTVLLNARKNMLTGLKMTGSSGKTQIPSQQALVKSALLARELLRQESGVRRADSDEEKGEFPGSVNQSGSATDHSSMTQHFLGKKLTPRGGTGSAIVTPRGDGVAAPAHPGGGKKTATIRDPTEKKAASKSSYRSGYDRERIVSKSSSSSGRSVSRGKHSPRAHVNARNKSVSKSSRDQFLDDITSPRNASLSMKAVTQLQSSPAAGSGLHSSPNAGGGSPMRALLRAASRSPSRLQQLQDEQHLSADDMLRACSGSRGAPHTGNPPRRPKFSSASAEKQSKGLLYQHMMDADAAVEDGGNGALKVDETASRVMGQWEDEVKSRHLRSSVEDFSGVGVQQHALVGDKNVADASASASSARRRENSGSSTSRSPTRKGSPFNGNGRSRRLLADVSVGSIEEERLTQITESLKLSILGAAASRGSKSCAAVTGSGTSFKNVNGRAGASSSEIVQKHVEHELEQAAGKRHSRSCTTHGAGSSVHEQEDPERQRAADDVSLSLSLTSLFESAGGSAGSEKTNPNMNSNMYEQDEEITHVEEHHDVDETAPMVSKSLIAALDGRREEGAKGQKQDSSSYSSSSKAPSYYKKAKMEVEKETRTQRDMTSDAPSARHAPVPAAASGAASDTDNKNKIATPGAGGASRLLQHAAKSLGSDLDEDGLSGDLAAKLASTSHGAAGGNARTFAATDEERRTASQLAKFFQKRFNSSRTTSSSSTSAAKILSSRPVQILEGTPRAARGESTTQTARSTHDFVVENEDSFVSAGMRTTASGAERASSSSARRRLNQTAPLPGSSRNASRSTAAYEEVTTPLLLVPPPPTERRQGLQGRILTSDAWRVEYEESKRRPSPRPAMSVSGAGTNQVRGGVFRKLPAGSGAGGGNRNNPGGGGGRGWW